MTSIGPISASHIQNLLGKTQELSAIKEDAASGILDITKVGAAQPALGASATSKAPASFDAVLKQAVQEVNHKMNVASTEQVKLLTGETNNVHQAVISMQEASVAFSLMVEVRNKLVESYQEMMRMQV